MNDPRSCRGESPGIILFEQNAGVPSSHTAPAAGRASDATTHGSDAERHAPAPHVWHSGAWAHTARRQPSISRSDRVSMLVLFWFCLVLGGVSIGLSYTGEAEALRSGLQAIN